MKVPVLLIAFNRLDVVKRVFGAIKQYEPDSLFLFADGSRPNKNGEASKCKRVREWLLNNVDWQCDVKTFFPEENFGCGKGPSSAISWFFENVSEGIILEDDTIPNQQFFQFATEMLERYRFNEQIMVIDSINLHKHAWGDGSYYFSKQTQSMCAWATWRRAWQYFEFTLKDYTERSVKNSIKAYGADKLETLWWTDVFKRFKKGEYGTSSWDYQFIFAIWRQHGLAIIPNVNMSSNIGFGEDATHTTSEDSVLANRTTYNIYPLVHPSKVKICQEADTIYHQIYYSRWQEIVPWHKKFKRWIKKHIRK